MSAYVLDKGVDAKLHKGYDATVLSISRVRKRLVKCETKSI